MLQAITYKNIIKNITRQGCSQTRGLCVTDEEEKGEIHSYCEWRSNSQTTLLPWFLILSFPFKLKKKQLCEIALQIVKWEREISCFLLSLCNPFCAGYSVSSICPSWKIPPRWPAERNFNQLQETGPDTTLWISSILFSVWDIVSNWKI